MDILFLPHELLMIFNWKIYFVLHSLSLNVAIRLRTRSINCFTIQANDYCKNKFVIMPRKADKQHKPSFDAAQKRRCLHLNANFLA